MAFLDVLRQKWISRNPILVFLVGYIASIIGVLTAWIIFPEDVGLMGLAFAALIMQPFLSKLLYNEEERKFREKRLSRKLFRDHSQTFKTILLLFFGILIAFSTMFLYSNQVRTKDLFDSQLAPYFNTQIRLSCFLNTDCFLMERTKTSFKLEGTMDEDQIDRIFGEDRQITGSAFNPIGYAASQCSTQFDCFLRYFQNNVVVLILVLFLSCFYGAGAILFLAWNASVWGTVFAFIARESSLAAGSPKYTSFMELFVRVFPHTILEASAYFLAVIAGVVITKALLKERPESPRFRYELIDGLLFFMLAVFVVVVAAFVEAYIFKA